MRSLLGDVHEILRRRDVLFRRRVASRIAGARWCSDVSSTASRPKDRQRLGTARAVIPSVGEWQIAVLQDLPPQKTCLLLKPSLVIRSHLGPPCR